MEFGIVFIEQINIYAPLIFEGFIFKKQKMDEQIIKKVTENIRKQNNIIKYLELQLKDKIDLRNMLVENRKECRRIYSLQLKTLNAEYKAKLNKGKKQK